MENKELLTEENYEKGKKKVMRIALVIFIIGILLGGSLITIGIVKKNKVNSKYSEESKSKIEEQLSQEKNKLEEKQKELENSITTSLETEKNNMIKSKSQLETKIKPVEDEIKKLERVKFNGFDSAYYARQDKIEELKKSIKEDQSNIELINSIISFGMCSSTGESNSYTAKYCQLKNNKTEEAKSLSVIKDTLDESFNHCAFNGAKNNLNTSKYCSLKAQLKDLNEGFGQSFESSKSIPFFMIGAFVIAASCMIAGSIYMFGKRREITAFTAQQVMPIAQEGMEKMTPTVAKSVGTISKEIAKGIKEGIKNPDKEEIKKERKDEE